MTLLEIIRKNKIATATDATVATHTGKTQLTVANVASVAVANCTDEKIIELEIEMIRAWLHKTGEPEMDHHLVLSKCRNDPETKKYFLNHARGQYDE